MTYRLKPKCIEAFEWGKEYPPRWFIDLVEKGKADVVINPPKEVHVNIYNKRGTYKGFVGDWVCKDEYSHVFIVSQKTFKERYEKI